MVAVGSDEVKLFEVVSGREVARLAAQLTGRPLPVSSMSFSADGKLLVTGGTDGGARLWDARTCELLATLVSLNAGADWLVVTPDGLFDGTPLAWNQILWRFSQNLADVTPVEVYFNEFFYPGLLAEIYAGRRPRAAQDVAQKDRRQPVVTIARADGQATSVSSRTVKIKIGIAEPGGGANPAGAQDVRLFRNGTLVKAWRGDALKGQKSVTLEAELPIIAGENRLTAYAFNRDNVKSSDAVMIVTGAESLRRPGTAWVIACGVNQYANAQYNLKYAVADATSFADEVKAQQVKLRNYANTEIIPLLDQDATKANLLLALRRLAGDAADRDLQDGRVLVREWFDYAAERVPQMQEKEMQSRLLLDFAENEAKSKDTRQRNVQRPRVFYRREAEARPLVVAKP